MKILIVDDEHNIRELMRKYLALEGLESDGAENGLSAQRLLREQPYDACLIDLKMPGMDGLSLIEWIRQEGFRMPIIMISAHGEIRDAVTALKEGAQDYIVKPFDPEELTIRLKKLIDEQNLRNLVESETITSKKDSDDLVGKSPAMMKIKDIISKIADSPATVLITGESGTGKEVVARQIHGESILAKGPFVAINIGGVPENLLESELFGYEKGAFTGAVGRKTGMFELASGGTLFLDEIGDMPLPLQVKMLRVLQERKITRLGGTTPMPINARIIAATNKNLEEKVRSGTFREDLFYRLNVVRIELPPLRERKEDLPLLAGVILKKLNRQMGHRVEGLSSDALDALKRHPFYGNVRELENILERAVIFADSSVLRPENLDLRTSSIKLNNDESHSNSAQSKVYNDNIEAKSLKEMEIEAIIRTLHRWEGNRTRAAEELKISRRTLINKIAEYHIDL
ncbi:MAG: sigma-54 dependent transcriptional regulator [Sphaerochaetaceae bacterium]|jgi:two-component system response regulator AtoC|nr:sigma-54 dependent transcriptional regulator [Sphaerochaetaceae bacterium]MDX9809688.1 sigma-54 dependent transcriptional regulator [Sphaerochaetaceae bacterium]NLV84291.1 sigma-54-dependent Fis family transcriptional regulator [Spirochaetales bacterium]